MLLFVIKCLAKTCQRNRSEQWRYQVKCFCSHKIWFFRQWSRSTILKTCIWPMQKPLFSESRIGNQHPHNTFHPAIILGLVLTERGILIAKRTSHSGLWNKFPVECHTVEINMICPAGRQPQVLNCGHTQGKQSGPEWFASSAWRRDSSHQGVHRRRSQRGLLDSKTLSSAFPLKKIK